MSRAQQQKSIARLRLAPAALGLGLAAALGVVGCSAGQVTQTDSQLPAVNGVQAQQGAIAVRDAQLAHPHGGSYPEGSAAPLVLTIVNTGMDADELTGVTSPLAAEVTVSGDTALPGGTALSVGTPGEEADVAKSSAATTPTPTGSASPTGSSAPSGSTATSAPSASAASSSTSGSVSATSSSGAPSASSSAATTATPTSSVRVERGKLEIVLTGLNAKLFPGRNIPVTFIFAKAGAITIELPIATPTDPRAEGADEH